MLEQREVQRLLRFCPHDRRVRSARIAAPIRIAVDNRDDAFQRLAVGEHMLLAEANGGVLRDRTVGQKIG